MVLISEDLSGASNEPDHVPPISGTCALDAARQAGSRDGIPAVRLAPSGRARCLAHLSHSGQTGKDTAYDTTGLVRR